MLAGACTRVEIVATSGRLNALSFDDFLGFLFDYPSCENVKKLPYDVFVEVFAGDRYQWLFQPQLADFRSRARLSAGLACDVREIYLPTGTCVEIQHVALHAPRKEAERRLMDLFLRYFPEYFEDEVLYGS